MNSLEGCYIIDSSNEAIIRYYSGDLTGFQVDELMSWIYQSAYNINIY
jgi:hypothetical protein